MHLSVFFSLSLIQNETLFTAICYDTVTQDRECMEYFNKEAIPFPRENNREILDPLQGVH